MALDCHRNHGVSPISERGSLEGDSLPDTLVLRLRHPAGAPILRAEVQGAKNVEIDPQRNCIRMSPERPRIQVRAHFK